jgi:hypothetical protein
METEVNHIDLREMTIDQKKSDKRKNLSGPYRRQKFTVTKHIHEFD